MILEKEEEAQVVLRHNSALSSSNEPTSSISFPKSPSTLSSGKKSIGKETDHVSLFFEFYKKKNWKSFVLIIF